MSRPLRQCPGVSQSPERRDELLSLNCGVRGDDLAPRENEPQKVTSTDPEGFDATGLHVPSRGGSSAVNAMEGDRPTRMIRVLGLDDYGRPCLALPRLASAHVHRPV